MLTYQLTESKLRQVSRRAGNVIPMTEMNGRSSATKASRDQCLPKTCSSELRKRCLGVLFLRLEKADGDVVLSAGRIGLFDKFSSRARKIFV